MAPINHRNTLCNIITTNLNNFGVPESLDSFVERFDTYQSNFISLFYREDTPESVHLSGSVNGTNIHLTFSKRIPVYDSIDSAIKNAHISRHD